MACVEEHERDGAAVIIGFDLVGNSAIVPGGGPMPADRHLKCDDNPLGSFGDNRPAAAVNYTAWQMP